MCDSTHTHTVVIEKCTERIDMEKVRQPEREREENGNSKVEKVSRTLVEALISSRLHRPRSEPLGASLPSN